MDEILDEFIKDSEEINDSPQTDDVTEETSEQSAKGGTEEASTVGTFMASEATTEFEQIKEEQEFEPIEFEPVESNSKVFFDSSKNAYSFPIETPLCTVELEDWKPFTMLTLGKDYDITADGIVDLRQTPEYISEKFEIAKANKHAENLAKAKQAVENGYITFKNAQFETNAQTVGDLTATMLMLEAGGISQYNWLSKDDKVVELTLEDFTTLGLLIANYKNDVWNNKYIDFKTAIEQAETIEELNTIKINYEVTNE